VPFLDPSSACRPARRCPRTRTSRRWLFVVEGDAVLDTDDGERPFLAGSLARYEGHEELRVSNAGDAPVTLLAYLTPPFPPR
jgi:hypothetical protein